jgi:hypothetical protein
MVDIGLKQKLNIDDSTIHFKSFVPMGLAQI